MLSPRALAAHDAVAAAPSPRVSGSIEIPLDESSSSSSSSAPIAVAGASDTSGPVPVAAPGADDASGPVAGPVRRRRANTASVIGGHVVLAADKVAQAAEAVGGKIGDVVGVSLTHLPGVPRTRRGAVMARGVVVGFCLVFAWIAVIVGLQLRGRRPPDFRPQAEATLVALREGQFHDVYLGASARFQEIVLEDTFTVQMTDLNRTLGRFREVASVIGTELNRGPGGRTGRVDLRLAFERASTRGSVSFRWEDDQWKLLGLSVEVPETLVAVVGTDEARRDRVAGNRAELQKLVEGILALSSASDYDAIWNQAAPGFQRSISLDAFRRTEIERHGSLGRFVRVLNVTSAKINPSQTGTSIDCLVEFANYTIKGSFEFTKIEGTWRLTFYKLVMPLPRTPD